MECSMNHVCARASSDKIKILNIFNKQLKTTDKDCWSMDRFTADCKCLNHCSKRDGKHKMKRRMKSRRERSQMRDAGKEASKYKSHLHCCCPQTRKDVAHFHNCCRSSCHCSSSRDARFPNVVPASQEPSIITDSRLTGHQGLFNHEVKSIDIERLLSEQRKLEKSGQEVQEKNNALTSHMPSPLSTNDLLGADTEKVMPVPTTKAHDDFQEKEKKFSQGSDLTPGQRPQQHLEFSSGSCKSIFSSKHTSFNVVVHEKGRESQQTPTVNIENVKTLNKKIKGNMISSLEHTPKNQESPAHQTQAHSVSPSPLQLSSSHPADSFDIQHRRPDPDRVSQAVRAVAASLCDCLQFPFLKRRSLLAESRKVLLKALRERHGPQLRENLLEVRRCFHFGTDDSTKEVQDQEPNMIDEDELLPTDAFTTASIDRQPRFDAQKTTTFKITRSKHFNRNSSPLLHHNPKQTAEWLASPVETSVSFLDDLVGPTHSPQFCMDFEPSGVAASDHLYTPSHTSYWGEKASASQHWEDRFNRPKSKDAVMFGSFENSFMNHTRAVTERSSGSQHNDTNIHPFFPYQVQLPDRQSAGPVHYPHERDPFETSRHSFALFSSAQRHHPQQPFFDQFSHRSTCPPLQSHHADMMQYPPSHMLESDSAPHLSSLPSPEDWSYPPMRLY